MSQDAQEGALERHSSGSSHHPDINWERAENSPEFKELVASRRKFVLPATIFFFAWYLIFILLAGYAEGFMGTTIYRGLTVGYTLALTQFVMVWGLSLAYLKKADRDWEPLERRAAARALEQIQEDLDISGPGASAGTVTR
jgi:uncharacterized membrane protein (DUF485 family)